ncbi:hypothetical protein [Clavibacter phaseoli]|uniref:hypothetical protein n=1 Tax=Clavibacter phaseoli TaxID=1734031 RepID=UPI000E66CAA3|nr:hypothetical protein [Clavibacter phaseoli]RIJ57606.1 hypothetical protein DZF99_02610 [Clavibacter phaseoli]UKF31168.1 hypothetical protein FGD69_08930 [Clavibacter phaseoli]UKF37087.1 hypothetical protein FGI33_08310 [Clavibacter phaseoli]
MIVVPRSIVLGLAALFSAYHMVLALVAIAAPADPAVTLLAVALYLAATLMSLWPTSPTVMPIWLAAFNLAVATVVPVLVTSQLSAASVPPFSTWHIAAVGTLMTITSARRRQGFAWAGVVILAVQTVLWAGPAGLVDFGVTGSALWVAVSHVLAHALAKAARDARQFHRAEREAADWQAAQEAHLYERQFRLRQTSRMAVPMLRRIVETGGDLSPEERQECLYLEGAIRDEIRGRTLLNDAVREQVMLARRRGTVVTLLDEGGIDDLDDATRDVVLDRLAEAVRDTRADKIIARTVPEGSDTAITVVGLSVAGDGSASLLGSDDLDDEVDLWLEIPRPRT